MKKLLAALALSAAAAQAAPIVTYVDVVDPSQDIRLTPWNPANNHYSFTHDIRDNGFSVGQQKILNVELAVTFADDGNDDMVTDGLEKVWIRIDGQTLVKNMEVNNGAYRFNVESQFLQKDGKLVVKLTAMDGDFFFKNSELTVTAEAVPEPTSVALTGLGLLALGFYARRRRNK